MFCNHVFWWMHPQATLPPEQIRYILEAVPPTEGKDRFPSCTCVSFTTEAVNERSGLLRRWTLVRRCVLQGSNPCLQDCTRHSYKPGKFGFQTQTMAYTPNNWLHTLIWLRTYLPCFPISQDWAINRICTFGVEYFLDFLRFPIAWSLSKYPTPVSLEICCMGCDKCLFSVWPMLHSRHRRMQ